MAVTVRAFPRFLHIRFLILLGRFACPGSWYLVITDSLYYCYLFSPLSTLQALVMGFVWPHIDACYVKVSESSHPEVGSWGDKLHPKTTPFPIERLQGANRTIVVSSHPSSFLPHHAFSSFSRYLLDFSFLSPFPSPSSVFCISFSHLGTVKPAARVAGEALYAYVKQPAQWETAGMCFGAGLMELGSAGLARSCLQMNRKRMALG